MELIVLAEHANERLDKYITERVEFTRSAICILIENGDVTLNGLKTNKSYKVREGDKIKIVNLEPKKLEVLAQDIPINICYEDDFLIVVNKVQGMVVHPAVGNYEKTLVNALMAHCGDNLSDVNGLIRPGIIHRIDKDTSGLLIVAKTNNAHLKLAEQIKNHSFLRVYIGIIYGHLKNESGIIDAPIGRHPINRKKMTVTEKNSKKAVTHYKVIERYLKYSLVEFRLETGRTHQIRVHMAYIGHPLLADPLYGFKNSDKMGLIGQCLHAKKIGFIHPETNEYIEFESELPEQFKNIINKLRV